VTEDGDAMLIKLAAGEQCLDVQGASRRNGANVLIWPCHGRANQRWRIPVNDTGEPPLTGIINGSFEEFVVSSDLRTWKLVRLDGWKALETRHIKETDKLSGIDVNSLKKEIDAEIWDAQTGLPASAGDYKVELDAHRKNIDALLQMFMVEAGKTYTLSFDAYGRKPESSDVEVWIDGYYVETISPVEQWQTYTYPVVEGETHSILLREVKQQSDGFGAVLDNVQLLSDDDREAPTVPQNLSATAIAGGVELAWKRLAIMSPWPVTKCCAMVPSSPRCRRTATAIPASWPAPPTATRCWRSMPVATDPKPVLRQPPRRWPAMMRRPLACR
jgi:hypothetical protein